MSEEVARLRQIVARLRAPDGCPWDREQTHRSLRSALVEECYEVIEAINQADDVNLREELGDVLLHVVMHAQMAAERGVFGFDDVVAEICEKLVRRHPHVFGDVEATNTADVLRQWDEIKQTEKGARESVLEGLGTAFPALMRAQHAQKKAARVGFDWDDASEVLVKIDEEMAEVREAMATGDGVAVAEEVGDLLFSVVNLSRKVHLDAETTLGDATEKFIRRFRAVEQAVVASGRRIEDCSTGELNAIWDGHKTTVP